MGGHAASLSSSRWNTIGTFGRHPFSMPGVKTVALDLGDAPAVRSLVTTLRPDVVLHCAALGNIDRCEADRSGTSKINAEAVSILADACARLPCRLILTSSDMVFDGEKGRYSEGDSVHPLNVYAESKCEAEKAVKALCPDHVVARLALVYGRAVTGGSSFSEGLLKSWEEGKTPSLFQDQFRSPIEAANCAEALLELAEGSFVGTIHLGGPDRVDRYGFGLVLAGLRGIPSERLKAVNLDDVTLQAKRPRDVSFDISRAASLL
ncbi:MAG TPA: SDR family oxidoreductase, partial [bacterium]